MEERMENPLGKTLIYVAISLFITFLGFLAGVYFIPAELAYALSLIFLITIIVISIIFFVSFRKRRNARFPMWIVYIYAFIEGITLYPVVLSYLAQLGVDVVLTVLMGTILWVLALGIVALKTNANYLKLGPILLIGLIIEIILSLVGIFFFNDFAMTILAGFGVLIFSGYVLFDIRALKFYIEEGLIQDKKDLSIHVLNIYIDIVAIFLRLLRIISYFTSDRD